MTVSKAERDRIALLEKMKEDEGGDFKNQERQWELDDLKARVEQEEAEKKESKSQQRRKATQKEAKAKGKKKAAKVAKKVTRKKK